MSRSKPLGTAGARVAWGIGDQALSSLTNVGLGIAVARNATTAGFGAFGIALATYLLALGVSRGLTSEPFVVRFSGETNLVRGREASRATGAALLLGLLLGAACLTGGLAWGGTSGGMFAALGVALPGLLLQDAWRYCYVAVGRSRDAFVIDLAWASSTTLLFALALSLGRPSAARLFLLWGASGALAGILAAARERVLPRPREAMGWVRDQRGLAFRYVGEFAAAGGSLQLTMYLVAILAGLPAAGALRAGFVLLGPVLVIFQGVRLVFVPEGVRLVRRSGGEVLRMTRVLAAVLAGSALGWGGVVFLLPASTGRMLLGSSWSGARALAVPLTLLLALSGVELAAVIALRALAAARASFRARIIEGALTLVGGTVGAAIGDARATAWALVAAYCLEVIVWWWQLGGAIERSSSGSPGRDAEPLSRPEAGSPVDLGPGAMGGEPI